MQMADPLADPGVRIPFPKPAQQASYGLLPACPQGCELPAFGEAGGQGGGVSQSRLRPLHAAMAPPQAPPTGTPTMMAALHPQGGRPPGLCDEGGQGWYCAFDALPPPPPAPPLAMAPMVVAPKSATVIAHTTSRDPIASRGDAKPTNRRCQWASAHVDPGRPQEPVDIEPRRRRRADRRDESGRGGHAVPVRRDPTAQEAVESLRAEARAQVA